MPDFHKLVARIGDHIAAWWWTNRPVNLALATDYRTACHLVPLFQQFRTVNHLLRGLNDAGAEMLTERLVAVFEREVRDFRAGQCWPDSAIPEEGLADLGSIQAMPSGACCGPEERLSGAPCAACRKALGHD